MSGKNAGQHPTTIDTAFADDVAVSAFSVAMRKKMARSRAKGRGGWQEMPAADLWEMLREHVQKGDPVDVANLAMMIWHNRRSVSNAE